ncbi:hypothetical protein Tco_1420042, partial [Tanacetum coccineum]
RDDDDNRITGASTKASGGSFDGVFRFELAWRADALNQRANSLEQWLQSTKKQAKIAFAMSKGKFTYPSLAARSLEGFHLATVLTQDCGRQGGKKPCSNINCSQCGFYGNTHAVTSKMDEESKQKLRQLEGSLVLIPVLQRFLPLDRWRIETPQAQKQADVNITLLILGLLCCMLQLMYKYAVASDMSTAADALSTTTSTLIRYIEGLHNCMQWSKGSLILRAGKRFTILQSGGSDLMKQNNEQTSVRFGAEEGYYLVADRCVSDAEMGDFQVLKWVSFKC